MTQSVLGIIGGSGFYNLPGLTQARWQKVEGPWGAPSDEILFAEIEGLLAQATSGDTEAFWRAVHAIINSVKQRRGVGASLQRSCRSESDPVVVGGVVAIAARVNRDRPGRLTKPPIRNRRIRQHRVRIRRTPRTQRRPTRRRRTPRITLPRRRRGPRRAGRPTRRRQQPKRPHRHHRRWRLLLGGPASASRPTRTDDSDDPNNGNSDPERPNPAMLRGLCGCAQHFLP